MKKLLLIFLFLFYVSWSQAQNFRFYGGLKGGPKLSFSNMVLPGYSDYENETNTLIRHQEGVVFGYVFKNQKFILESGFSLQTYGAKIKFTNHPVYGSPPEFWYNYSGEQSHLHAKFLLNGPEAKVKFKALGGLAYLRKYPGFQRSNFPGIAGVLVEFPYEQERPEKFGLDPPIESIFLYPAGQLNFILLNFGFETEVKLSKHLAISGELVYQNSLKPVEIRTFDYTYNLQGDVIYEPVQYGGVISKAEAISLNIGLTYSFSNRNKNSE